MVVHGRCAGHGGDDSAVSLICAAEGISGQSVVGDRDLFRPAVCLCSWYLLAIARATAFYSAAVSSPDWSSSGAGGVGTGAACGRDYRRILYDCRTRPSFLDGGQHSDNTRPDPAALCCVLHVDALRP